MIPSTPLIAAITLSIAKPLLIFLTFLPWAWLVSSRLDKDARYFHLNRRRWNAIQLAAGVAGLAAMVLLPYFWFLGWPAGIACLLGPVLAYWKIRNDAVPEKNRFHLSGLGIGTAMAARKQSRASRGAMIRFTSSTGGDVAVPAKDDPAYATHILAEDIIGPAVESRASVVEMSIASGGATVSQIVDGIRYKREAVPAEAAMQLLDHLKGIAGLSVQDRRRRQTGDFGMVGPLGKFEIKLTTAGSSSSVDMRLAFDVSKRLRKPFDGLGLLPSQLQALRKLEEPESRHGIVLVGAPSGQGLSTSAYSFVGRHDAYTANIKTLELNVLVHIDGVDHVEWDPSDSKTDYATRLQSILRRDPDIVLAGDVSDRATAKVVTDPGLNGPIIYVPRRGTTIAGILRDWVKVVGDLKRASAALVAVTNQRLVRKLCPNCRQPYTPSAQQLAKLNIPEGKVKHLYQANGKVQVKNKIERCPVCGGTGYLEQTGVFEVLMIDREARRLLLAGDLKGVLAHARRQKMVYIQEAALAKVVAGETTIEEVVRVTSPTRAEKPARPKPDPDPDPAPATSGQ